MMSPRGNNANIAELDSSFTFGRRENRVIHTQISFFSRTSQDNKTNKLNAEITCIQFLLMPYLL